MTKNSYQVMLFDCDGVILNSNYIKTEAFYKVASSYGKKNAQDLVDYHLKNGGISRYVKFEYFLNEILGFPSFDNHSINNLLNSYSKIVKQSLLKCDVATDIHKLRKLTSSSNWAVISGGDQNELREVFLKRGLSHYFDLGIFGSPLNKFEIIETKFPNLSKIKSLFIGDSIYDYEISKKFNLDFIFLTDWSDIDETDLFLKKNKITMRQNLTSLLDSFQ